MTGAGVSADDYAVLSALGRYGDMSPTQLSGRLGLYLTTTLFRVGRLEQRMLVRRYPNPNDRRSFLLTLTDEGRDRWDAGGAKLRESLLSLEGQLPTPAAEVRRAILQLTDALERVLESLVKEEDAGAPAPQARRAQGMQRGARRRVAKPAHTAGRVRRGAKSSR